MNNLFIGSIFARIVFIHHLNKCKNEAPELQWAYQTYKDPGVLVLGAFTLSNEKEIKKFAGKYHMTYQVDHEGGIAEELGAKGIPETFFIARDSRIKIT